MFRVDAESMSKRSRMQASSCEKKPQTIEILSRFEKNVGAERASSPTKLVCKREKDGAGEATTS